MRNFRVDLALPGEIAPTLLALKAAMEAHRAPFNARNSARAAKVAARNEKDRALRTTKALAGKNAPHLT